MTAVLASARCPAFDSYEFLTFRLINTHDHVWNEVVFRRMGLPVPLEILNTFPKEKIFVDLSFLGMCSKRCWPSSQLKCMQLDSSGVSRRLRLPWIHICYRTTFIGGFKSIGSTRYSISRAASWPMAVPSGAKLECQISNSAVIKHVANAWAMALLARERSRGR